MINTFKHLQAGRLDQCQDKFAFPVMRWMSSPSENIDVCAKANLLFFKVKPKVIFSILNQCTKKGFFKYPKKAKVEEDDVEEIVRTALKKLYSWSDLEYEKNKTAISFTTEFYQELNKHAHFEQKECKKLGLKFEKAEKYEYTAKPAAKNLFNF